MTDPAIQNDRDRWLYRRRAIFASLIFIAGCVVYLLGWGADTELNNTIANGLILAGSTILVGYTLGAVWDDSQQKRFGHVGGLGAVARNPSRRSADIAGGGRVDDQGTGLPDSDPSLRGFHDPSGP